MFDKKILLTALGSLALVAGSASAATIWSDDFGYAAANDDPPTPTQIAANEAGMDANGWDTPGTFGSDYGVTNGGALWGNGGVAMPLLTASTGHILADGDDIELTINVNRVGGYSYGYEFFAWDGVTATSLGGGTHTGTPSGTYTASASAAHVGQELIFTYVHSVNWGETDSLSVDVEPIPEPGSLALLGLGGLLIARRRRG